MNSSLFYNKSPQKSTVESVVNRVKDLILRGSVKSGDLLPSETVLCRRMGVSRSSVREAMKILSALGVVEVKRGDGTYISAGTDHVPLEPFLLRLALENPDLRQLVEFREMIETQVVECAVRRKDRAGIDGMRSSLDRMRTLAETRANPDMASVLDLEFHKALGQTTGNRLIAQLYGLLLGFFEPSIRRTYRRPGNLRRALALHEVLLGFIESGDGKSALKAVRQSIHDWAERS